MVKCVVALIIALIDMLYRNIWRSLDGRKLGLLKAETIEAEALIDSSSIVIIGFGALTYVQPPPGRSSGSSTEYGVLSIAVIQSFELFSRHPSHLFNNMVLSCDEVLFEVYFRRRAAQKENMSIQRNISYIQIVVSSIILG